MGRRWVVATAAVMLLAVLATLFNPSAALSFDLHHDFTPVCLMLEITGQLDTTIIKVHYTSNLSNFETGEHHRVIQQSDSGNTLIQLASQLEVILYYPRGDDQTSEREQFKLNTYLIPPATKKSKLYNLKVTPKKKLAGQQAIEEDNRHVGDDVPYITGAYEVCFKKHDKGFHLPFFKEMWAGGPKEKCTVGLTFFGSSDPVSRGVLKPPAEEHERVPGHQHETYATRRKAGAHLGAAGTSNPATEQMQNENYKEHMAHHGQSSWSVHDKLVAKERLDNIYGALHNVDRLLKETKKATEELRERHHSFQVTSNSVFTRTWIFSLLTMCSMAFVFFSMYRSVKKAIISKKLV